MACMSHIPDLDSATMVTVSMKSTLSSSWWAEQLIDPPRSLLDTA